MIPESDQAVYAAEIAQIVVHDHDPINDAHKILLEYVYAMKYKALQAEHIKAIAAALII
jgi:hypothetical protein